MSNNGFSVNIRSTDSKVNSFDMNGHRYVSLDHDSTYSVLLSNSKHARKCDATLYIDGEKMGKWRIGPYGKISLERPVNISKKFRFVKEGKHY